MTYARKKDCSGCGYESGDNLGGACDDGFGGAYEQGPNSQASDSAGHYDGTQAASLYDKDAAEKEGGLDAYAAADEMKARDDADSERQKQDELTKRFGQENDWMKQRDELEARPSHASLKDTIEAAGRSFEDERKQAMRYEDDRKTKKKSEDEEDY